MSHDVDGFLPYRLLLAALVSSLVACGGGATHSSTSESDPITALQMQTPQTASEASRFAYVPNYDTNDISVFRVNAATGGLSWVSNTPAGTGPGAVVVDAAGKHAYVPNYDSNNISVYTIARRSGALIPTGAPVATGIWPTSLSIAPTGRFAYVSNFASNSVSIFSVDPASGALSNIGTAPTGINPRYLVIEPSGRYLYTANWGSKDITVFAADATTGLLTQIGLPFAVPGTPFNLSADRTGTHLYMTDFLSRAGTNGLSSLRIDPESGSLTNEGINLAAGAHPNAISMDPSGRFVYVVNSLDGAGGNSVSAYTVASGAESLTPVECTCGQADYTTGSNPASANVSPSGTHLYVANVTSNDITIFTIHATSGALSKVGSTSTAGTYPMGITFTPTLL